jgi:hypothetical protein
MYYYMLFRPTELQYPTPTPSTQTAGEPPERGKISATLIELAVLCACSSTTVHVILIAAGVEMRPLGRPITRRVKP